MSWLPNHPASIETVAMVLLNTNVVSELMRKSLGPAVGTWVARDALDDLFFSALGEAELRYGAAIMPVGRRKDTLASDIKSALRATFDNGDSPFNSDAASAYAEITADRRTFGRPISELDGQSAAIARSRGTAVVTRNVRGFVGMGIDVIDPWTSA